MREAEVRQRFTVVSGTNDELARSRSEELSKWRDSLHGGHWREYAKIADVWDPERSLEWKRAPRAIAAYR